jgi:hypothetical protein
MENESEFKPSGDGYVKKEAVDNKLKAEFMAHAEDSIRSKMDEAIALEINKIKGAFEVRAQKAGLREEQTYEAKVKIVEFFDRNKNPRIIKLEYPRCCIMDKEEMKKVAIGLIDSKTVGLTDGEEFLTRTCDGRLWTIDRNGEVGPRFSVTTVGGKEVPWDEIVGGFRQDVGGN